MAEAEGKLCIALAGNANVGKSVIFNELTGLSQVIGNWPGKTVEKATGSLFFEGRRLNIIDLPGIYSFSTFSEEEIVSRQFIAEERPDVIVNVVDATVLERNLFFTLQLIELEVPFVVALNMYDIARNAGIDIDIQRLSAELGVPVIPTVAVKRVGLTEMLRAAIGVAVQRPPPKPRELRYGSEIESRTALLSETIKAKGRSGNYPPRWTAIKLLEQDSEVEAMVFDQAILNEAARLRSEIESIHGEPVGTVITSERYTLAHRICSASMAFKERPRPTLSSRIDSLTTHGFWGYVVMALIMVGMFYAVFSFGSWASGLLDAALDLLRPFLQDLLGSGAMGKILGEGLVEGLFAGIAIAIPFILPFYLMLSVLEDSGYLARIAFLMDAAMHRMGLHGKAFIPMLLGFGCNVPAVLGCRIMETRRERLIAAFVSTLVPCTARTVVILALVGKYLGVTYALSLYVIDIAIIFALGRIAYKTLPGEPIGLIMEMPSYKRPSGRVIARQTWFRVSGFVRIAFPIIAIAGVAIKAAEMAGVLNIVSNAISPITVGLLGLPSAMGVLLIVGILRKELTVLMLATLLGTQHFNAVLSPLQMYVFAFVVMLYIPCVATIAALVEEFNWKEAAYVTMFEIAFAAGAGGLLYRVLLVLGWH